VTGSLTSGAQTFYTMIQVSEDAGKFVLQVLMEECVEFTVKRLPDEGKLEVSGKDAVKVTEHCMWMLQKLRSEFVELDVLY